MRFLQSLGSIRRVQREDFLVEAARGKRSLHVGCVDSGLLDERVYSGTLLHERLEQAARELWGLDSDVQGIRRMQDLGYRFLHEGSAEDPPSTLPAQYFDVIIAGEVIEHVRNVGRFLDSMAGLLRMDGSLIVTTPNALRFYNPLPTLLRRELVHPDHVAWYSPHTLRRAVEMAPLQVCDVLMYESVPYLNTQRSTNRVGRLLRAGVNSALRITHAAAVRVAPHTADGLIITARVRQLTDGRESSR